MADILEFPSLQAQGLAFLDRELRRLLEKRGADPALIDFAATQLTDIYSEITEQEDYQLKLAMPPELSAEAVESIREQVTEGLAAISRQNHAMLVRLAAQLVMARVQLFQRERG
jgi:hypothetical protein